MRCVRIATKLDGEKASGRFAMVGEIGFLRGAGTGNRRLRISAGCDGVAGKTLGGHVPEGSDCTRRPERTFAVWPAWKLPLSARDFFEHIIPGRALYRILERNLCCKYGG